MVTKERVRPREQSHAAREHKPARDRRPRVVSKPKQTPITTTLPAVGGRPATASRNPVVVAAVAAEMHPPPWAKPSVTRPNAYLLSMAGTTMFVIALVAYYVVEVDMLAYVPYAIAQGCVGWGGYFLSRLCHWEAPYPAVYKPFDTNNTLLWLSVGLGGIIAITFVTYQYTQLTANTFLVGAYIVLAAVTESQFFHVALVDVGAALGRVATKARWGEIVGKIAVIPVSDWYFMLIHTEYVGNDVALLTVVLVGTLFCTMYAIGGNTDAIIWTHLIWNLLMVIKFVV